MRKMIRASIALELIWLPQVAPTNETLIWLTGMWNADEIALATCVVTAGTSDEVWTTHCEVRPVRCCTVAWPPPAESTTCAIALWLVDEFAGNWKLDPPLNSSLKLSPRVSSATMLISRMRPEIVYHSRWRPTKLKETSPR